MKLTKKWFIALLLIWPMLFGLGVWDGEYAMSAVTGFGVTIATYYEQQLERLDKRQATIIRDAANSKVMMFVFGALMLAFSFGVFFFDQPQVPLLDTIHLVLGTLLTLRGLLIRSAYEEAMIDSSKAIRL
ncbi:hypothetical protein [Exiguobacterium aurantiacum]|uniref:Uncharacterized protein n=1 Tax=Exiguobacterium aurantiacum TaxID=33987 RepID=A0A377FXP1_9BACL|nr:hypothetical protein [Exiguobacterium aurantiacum]STO09276.1 Uncharacterised protein [Exiguobacterium aurantiacum]